MAYRHIVGAIRVFRVTAYVEVDDRYPDGEHLVAALNRELPDVVSANEHLAGICGFEVRYADEIRSPAEEHE